MVQRKLPPWEEIQFFNDPVVTVLPAPHAGVQVVAANPQRVVLVLSCATAGNAQLAPFVSTLTQGGIALDSSTPTIIITEKDHGPLCTCAWFSVILMAVPLTVVEVILRQWPDEEPE